MNPWCLSNILSSEKRLYPGSQNMSGKSSVASRNATLYKHELWSSSQKNSWLIIDTILVDKKCRQKLATYATYFTIG